MGGIELLELSLADKSGNRATVCPSANLASSGGFRSGGVAIDDRRFSQARILGHDVIIAAVDEQICVPADITGDEVAI